IEQRRSQGDRAEGGPADAKYDDVLEGLPAAVREALDLVDEVTCKGKRKESQFARASARFGVGMRGGEARRERLQRGGVDSATTEPRSEHVVVIEGDGHRFTW